MTEQPLRAALVGCGRIARTHCRYLKALKEARLVALCDPVGEAVAALGRETGVETQFTDLDRMLAEVRPDVVHVLTPPATHAGVAVKAMEGGAHVLVEKPMATTTREADEMLAVASRTGRALGVDHNRWFDPPVQEVVALLESGMLGDLVGVDVFQGAVAEEAQAMAAGAKQDWRAALPGGIMHDLAAHPAYLLLNLVGAPKQMHVGVWREGGKAQEMRIVVCGKRALGTLTLSLRARPFTNTLRLLGTRMTAEVNLNNMTLLLRRERQGPKIMRKVMPNVDEAAQLLLATMRNTVAFVTGRQRYYPGMGILIERFYRHLATGAAAPTTGEDGRAVAEFLDRVWALGAGAGESRSHA